MKNARLLDAFPLVQFIKRDCFAAATAIQRQAVLVTGDTELKRIEPLVSIEWV